MKKIYLLGFASMFAFAANAQTALKVKLHNGKKSGIESATNAKLGTPNSVQQVAGSITCATQYTAGTSMTLNFVFTPTNNDGEYVDSLGITFPAGITPVTSANNPFAPITDNGTGQTAAALHAPVGQDIWWGQNDNGQYGGIETLGNTGGVTSYNFSVDVTIGAGVTGTQIANFTASGDTYGTTPGDLVGTISIYPVGASIVDLTTTFIQPLNLTSTANCNYGMDTLVAQIKNLGTTTESNISVTYSVNGVAQPATVIPGPLAPGDSSYVFWLPAFDFSATNTYALKAWTAQPSEGITTNDTAVFSFRNHQSIALTSTVYTNGIETATETGDITLSGTAAAFTGLSTGTFHTGVQALFTTVAVSNPAGTYEVFEILPCMDVVAGETYRISYWRKVNNNPATNAGSGGIFTGLTPNGAAMTALSPYSVITPTAAGSANFKKDSVDFTASVSETRYFAISGQGTVNATTSFNFRVDDINITKVTPVGISKVVNNNDIVLYPNPSTGVVNLTVGTVNSQVEVFSVIGERVYSKSQLNKGNNTLDLSSLSEGTYIVRILSGAEVSTKKIVISK